MTDPFEAAELARAEHAAGALSPALRDALVTYLTRDDHHYDGSRLRVGADLKPQGDACDRATWYRLHGHEVDPPQLARRLRYERGRAAQRLFAEALKHAGREIREEVLCRPLRPSAWAWDNGHGDVLDVGARHLYEVKAPGSDAWARAAGMPSRLVSPAYAFQLSRYFHDLKRMGKVDTASWVFFDLGGDHDPVEVDLAGDLLVPLDAIVALEAEKAHLIDATEPPPRPANEVVVLKVLKGGRATKKNPYPQRVVRAVDRRFWACNFCDHTLVCQPGPAETPVELAADDPRRAEAVRAAEADWAREDAEKKRAKIVPEDSPSETTSPGVSEAPPQQATPPVSPLPAAAGSSPTRESDPCPTCGGSGTSSGGGLCCPDCLESHGTASGGRRGNGVRNPKLWNTTLAEIEADEHHEGALPSAAEAGF